MFGLDKYKYIADKTLSVYSFVSIGPKGPIQKIAKFKAIGGNVYNFGFGDYDPASGDILDTHVSNNQDTERIMGTVGSIIHDFTNVCPAALIFFQGTNDARTRLYQIHINKRWEEINTIFDVFGLKNDQWNPFKKGVNYDAFLGRRKDAYFVD